MRRTFPRSPIVLAIAAVFSIAGCADQPITAPKTLSPNSPSLRSIDPAHPVVTSLADPGDGVCDVAGVGDGCTLREATLAAGVSAEITFAPGLSGAIEL